ncbi:uncharacterized protein LOC125774030 [Anopheles funestus]|uniref:uncharacterized protein LOC125774030 n=1 Tax=Anopheles funestus TaxID=62324 RepID=UPI0020C6D086|nr:uncharacterized protein LOC125774030 [Anopheles funestus]
MAQQKFFSGLTEGMINRASGERPDRQKTHFYWPDEYAPEPEPSATINGHPLNRRPSEAPIGSSPQPTIERRPDQQPPTTTCVPAVVRDRLPKHAESHIQFYDGVGSSFGELERTKAHERFRIEQFLRQQSEEETGEAARAKRLSTLQSKIEFYDYCTPVNGTSRRNAVPSGRFTTQRPDNGYAASEHERNGEVFEQDAGEDELDFDDRSSYRSSICSSTHTTPTSGHRHHAGSELPEHKRNSQRHLRSSINFHNGCTIADDSEDPKKPVSVRESATNRVGVGLPNL